MFLCEAVCDAQMVQYLLSWRVLANTFAPMHEKRQRPNLRVLTFWASMGQLF